MPRLSAIPETCNLEVFIQFPLIGLTQSPNKFKPNHQESQSLLFFLQKQSKGWQYLLTPGSGIWDFVYFSRNPHYKNVYESFCFWWQWAKGFILLGLACGYNSNGRQMHMATLSILLWFLPFSSVQSQFRGGKQLQNSIIIRPQRQLLIDPGCYVMPVRSKQAIVAAT